MDNTPQNIVIDNTADGKASVKLYARDGMVWMSQNELAELFDTSVANISTHVSNILKEKELSDISVVKDYLTTAADGKKSNQTATRSSSFPCSCVGMHRVIKFRRGMDSHAGAWEPEMGTRKQGKVTA